MIACWALFGWCFLILFLTNGCTLQEALAAAKFSASLLMSSQVPRPDPDSAYVLLYHRPNGEEDVEHWEKV